MTSVGDTKQLFWVRRTVMQMLRDRGYKVKRADIQLHMADFLERYGDLVDCDELTIQRARIDDPSDQVNVFFLDESKADTGAVRVCVDKMKQANVASGILVLQKALSGPSRAEVLQSKKYRLEVSTHSVPPGAPRAPLVHCPRRSSMWEAVLLCKCLIQTGSSI